MSVKVVNGPATSTSCQRSDERHTLPHSQEAFVEFVHSGERWRLELLGVSAGGVCFGLQNGQPLLARGAILNGAILEIAAVKIEGALKVAHATEEFSAGTICGGQFEPATDEDGRKLKEVIARLGW